MSVIAIPNILKNKLGEEATDALVVVLEKIEHEFKDSIVENVEIRFEKRLAEECAKLRTEMNGLRVEMHALRADIIRWMFLFWIGQLASIIAVFSFFFKH
ncbi:MAG: hypothetical protein HY591_00175 [Candidatus Omnitrophica bacterium]|nr:hypothetical protein [Candidatus Omnitrophota bacterium]